MKNLSANSLLSLFAAFSILITLVVCLADFTGAEVWPSNRLCKRDRETKEELFKQSLHKNVDASFRQILPIGDVEWSQLKNFANLNRKIEPEGGNKEIVKRNTKDTEEKTREVDDEVDKDGYGYDDDEYYHFDFKRNENPSPSSDNKNSIQEEFDKKDELYSQKTKVNKNNNEKDKEKDKEGDTVEILSFNEYHSTPTDGKSEDNKWIGHEPSHKKLPSDAVDNLNMNDFKENIAIDEKMKGRKEESTGLSSSGGSNEQKGAEPSKSAKLNEEKDNLKLKESKYKEDSEKKVKESSEASVKTNEESIADKSLKENLKNNDEKEKLKEDFKNMKENENVKLKENTDKISEKSKDGFASKITKENKEDVKIASNTNSNSIGSSSFSQLNNRVSFVGNDYKDHGSSFKEADLDYEKASDEMTNNKNIGLSDCEENVAQEKANSKKENIQDDFQYSNLVDSYDKENLETGKLNDFISLPSAFEVKNNDVNNVYGKLSMPWNENIKTSDPSRLNYVMKSPYRISFPQSELENTEYHKNFVKSLRRYKGIDEETKSENNNKFSCSDHASSREKNKNLKKRSKPKKKKSIFTHNDRNNDWNSYPSRTGYMNQNSMCPQTCQPVPQQPQHNYQQQQHQYQQQQHQYQQQPHSYQQQQQQPQQSTPSPYPIFEIKTCPIQSKNCDIEESADRRKRKSIPKLEYEIKIINQNPTNSKNSPLRKISQKRRRKDLETKFINYASDKYPEEGLIKVKEIEEKKHKRKAPLGAEKDQFESLKQVDSSILRNRGAPSGYYGNRVKFGQKHVMFKDEKPMDNLDSKENDEAVSLTDKKVQVAPEPNYLQQSWKESKTQDMIHDPTKRHDENGIFSKTPENSLLLVKKEKNDDKMTKGLYNEKKKSESSLDSDQLTKILSKDKDYLIVRKNDGNELQKVDGQDHLEAKSFSENPKSKNYDALEINSKNQLKDSNKNIREVFARSHRSNDDKYQNQGPKSGLKKSFEKLKEITDFFKDGGQVAEENQPPIQEGKTKGEIVFSEDKLPDPIIISNEVEEKIGNLKHKPQNTMSSISTNFKQLDQKKNNNDVLKYDEINSDTPNNEKSSWEPALKNVFPEAKSINSVQKNGNEIIVLDFDRNQLKTNQGKEVIVNQKSTLQDEDELYLPFGTVQRKPNPLNVAGNRQIEVVLNDNSLPTFLDTGYNKVDNKKTVNPPVNKYSSIRINDYDKSSQNISPSPEHASGSNLPFDQLVHYLYKQYSDKKFIPSNNYRTIAKKSIRSASPELKGSNNLDQFLKDYRELTDLNNDPIAQKFKLNKKRNLRDFSNIPVSNLPQEQLYPDASVKQVGNFLQSIMSDDSSEGNLELSNKINLAKNPISDFDENTPDEPQGKWVSDNDKLDTDISAKQDANDFGLKNFKDDVNNFFQNEESHASSGANDFESNLWEGLSEASNTVQKMRREGVAERKLRKIMEDAMPLRGKRWSKDNNKNSQNLEENESDNKFSSSKVKKESEKNSMNDQLVPLNVDEQKSKNSKDSSSQFDSKEDSENKRSLKMKNPEKLDLKSSFSNFVSTLSNARDQMVKFISSRENMDRWKSQRRKRSLNRDSKPKVSKSEVQNKILNLEEDNYQSVYFPGIRRKLFSINDDAGGADVYYFADENEKKVTDEKRPDCVKNTDNKCINPFILDLFRGSDSKSEETTESRARRSLFSASHSNYKREIDLDESMPNDFQNFLVTSLGLDSHATSYGSQKREAVKKEEALWEGKDSSQDNYNQIVDNAAGGKDANEDSSLEKREVPTSDNNKKQNLNKNSDYFENGNEGNKLQSNVIKTVHQSNLNSKMQEKKSVQDKKVEFKDSKMPTQIRIQITKASSKEKKSSNPFIEESEATRSGSVEKMPLKEKNFFTNNKYTSSSLENSPKPMTMLKYKNAADMQDMGISDNFSDRDLYMWNQPFLSRRRKKKKYAQENLLRPSKDFTFDQKTMESLMKRYFSDQNIPGMLQTQKLPPSSHLPQIETVYNPTQGTNKAQLDAYKPILKANSLSNKNPVTAKGYYQSSEPFRYDDAFIRSYQKGKSLQFKNDKEAVKDFDYPDWKPYGDTTTQNQNVNKKNEFGNHYYKPYAINPNPLGPKNYFDVGQKSSTSMASTRLKYLMPSCNNYFSKNPIGNNFNYENLALKKQTNAPVWSTSSREISDSKGWRKPSSNLNPSTFGKDAKQKNKHTNSHSPPSSDDVWTFPSLYYLNQKPASGKFFKFRNFLNMKGDAPQLKFSSNKMKFMKALGVDKPPFFDSNMYHIGDNKEPDYSDGLDDEYIDDGTRTDPQFDSLMAQSMNKKYGKTYDFNYKNPTDGVESSDDDDEVYENYDENVDEGLDQYSFLTASNPFMLRQTPKGTGENNKLMNNYFLDDSYTCETNPYACATNDLRFRSPHYRGNSFVNKRLGGYMNQFSPVMLSGENKIYPLKNSFALLKKMNENENILEKNLLLNLQKNTYDEGFTDNKKAIENRSILGDEQSESLMDNGLELHSMYNERQQKANRLTPVGNGLYYATKAKVIDAKDTPPILFELPLKKNTKNTYYSQLKRNVLNAELRGTENEFEYESERNNKELMANLLNSDKNELGMVKYQANYVQDNGTCSNNSEDIRDVKENLEDGGETISEDNVLENVIGKYIMRKSIKVKPDQSLKMKTLQEKNQEKSFNLNEIFDDTTEHKRRKKSLESDIYTSADTKIDRKRLIMGHLGTEINFKKYHKKNPHQARSTRNSSLKSKTNIETEVNSGTFLNNLEKSRENEKKNDELSEEKNKNYKWANEKQQGKKRSLNIFKKLGKEKDTKKDDGVDTRNVGFEPIYSAEENGIITLVSEDQKGYAKISDHLNDARHLNNPYEFSRGKTNDIKKINAPTEMERIFPQSNKLEGPWKIELNEKFDEKSTDQSQPIKYNQYTNGKVIEKTSKIEGTHHPDNSKQDVKVYLVFQKNVDSNHENPKLAARAFLPPLGPSKSEVRKRYLNISKRNRRKRSEEWCLDSTGHPDKRLSIWKTNRALQDTKSITEADSISQTSHVAQTNASFVKSQEPRIMSGCEQKRVSNGRPKRNSVFPPLNDANIMGDNRHVDEETSQDLSQHIVDTILSRVNSDSRFKEFIAPAFKGKGSGRQDKIDDKKRTINRAEYLEQVQFLLQKVMVDIEKLAEDHVKRRMCNKIDKQSKEFLNSLLKVPAATCSADENNTPSLLANISTTSGQKQANNYGRCCDLANITSNQLTNDNNHLSPMPNRDKTSKNYNDQILETLKKKQNMLTKLIDDYHRLSEVEKQAINVNFQYLQNELNYTNQLMSSVSEKNGDSKSSDGSMKEESERVALKHSDKGGNWGVNKNPDESSGAKTKSILAFQPMTGVLNKVKSTSDEETNIMSEPGFEKVNDKTGAPQSYDLLPQQSDFSATNPISGQTLQSAQPAASQQSAMVMPSPQVSQPAPYQQPVPAAQPALSGQLQTSQLGFPGQQLQIAQSAAPGPMQAAQPPSIEQMQVAQSAPPGQQLKAAQTAIYGQPAQVVQPVSSEQIAQMPTMVQTMQSAPSFQSSQAVNYAQPVQSSVPLKAQGIVQNTNFFRPEKSVQPVQNLQLKQSSQIAPHTHHAQPVQFKQKLKSPQLMQNRHFSQLPQLKSAITDAPINEKTLVRYNQDVIGKEKKYNKVANSNDDKEKTQLKNSRELSNIHKSSTSDNINVDVAADLKHSSKATDNYINKLEGRQDSKVSASAINKASNSYKTAADENNSPKTQKDDTLDFPYRNNLKNFRSSFTSNWKYDLPSNSNFRSDELIGHHKKYHSPLNKKIFYPEVKKHGSHIFKKFFLNNLYHSPKEENHISKGAFKRTRNIPDIDDEDYTEMFLKRTHLKHRVKRFSKKVFVKKKKLLSNVYSNSIEPSDDIGIDKEDSGLEYLAWSSMPAVRRRLNNLELGADLHENAKTKVYKEKVCDK